MALKSNERYLDFLEPLVCVLMFTCMSIVSMLLFARAVVCVRVRAFVCARARVCACVPIVFACMCSHAFLSSQYKCNVTHVLVSAAQSRHTALIFSLLFVSGADIDLASKLVSVTSYMPDTAAMLAAVTAAGYPASLQPSPPPLTQDTSATVAPPAPVPASVVQSTSAPSAEEPTLYLAIEGLRCMKNCGSKAVAALRALPNVTCT